MQVRTEYKIAHQYRLVFRTVRKKIHQNFPAAKYDIKQYSDAT